MWGRAQTVYCGLKWKGMWLMSGCPGDPRIALAKGAMSSFRRVLLIDRDAQRRAAVGRQVFEGGIHVEPFESATELSFLSDDRSLLLLYDDGASLDDWACSGVALPVVCFAEQPSVQMVVNAMRAGALDYLIWPCAPDVLLAGLSSWKDMASLYWSATLRRRGAQLRVGKLTKREREVLQGMVNGETCREIGERLGISPRTVEIHRGHALIRVGDGTSAGAIRVAVESGEFG